MANRLARESSPYLLQHADNPVDWLPWGEEALALARAEDKPIFLSIGYSACHWCHVMAHESFEDPLTAAVMNEHFVNVKVDREERPDLDQIYMAAVQAMTGRGGWPMSVFLAPDGTPFYGGTYFPPQPRYGMPAFVDVLRAVADAWGSRRAELVAAGGQLTEAIARQNRAGAAAGAEELEPETLDRGLDRLRADFDATHGGWGGAPKFPQPMILEFLLRVRVRTGDEGALAMVTETLDAMARGGMYDQLGGGFHRYAVDDRWLVPHFEKMLYDNAQLVRVYLHAWQLTGEPFYRTIAEETLDYVAREMRDPAGGFYAAQDADSEGEEGKFFVWTVDEIRATLGAEADAFMAAYGVRPEGNWEGKNVLELTGALAEREALAGARRRLWEVREGRVRPGRDDKVLTSWNGLMLAAFSAGGRILGRADYLEIAEANAGFLLGELRGGDGRLWHAWKDGRARLNGYLEDYGYLIDGLLELYQATFEPRWFVAARELAETMLTHFGDPAGSLLYDTSDDHEALVVRPRDLQDNATPSGNGMAATVLLKLAGLTHDLGALEAAQGALAAMQLMLARYPLGVGQWLQAMAYAVAPPREIAIVGEAGAADTEALLGAVREGYRPFQVVALGAPSAQSPAVPLLEDRELVDEQAAVYVCRDFACQAPVTEPAKLQAQLAPR